MRVYLDNCCFNRPFDDQSQLKIKLETDAKLFIQNKILQGEYELVWSYVMDIENSQNPFDEKRDAIADWERLAVFTCEENEKIIEYAESLLALGIRPKDALHIACAVDASCDCFVTTDKKLLNTPVEEIGIVSPLTFIDELEG